MIGERTNANGSKKFREAMLEGDYDTCSAMATDQIKEGAHVLDVCVDYVGRDGTVDMDEIASRFATQANAPLVLDSTEPEVMEAGLQCVGGRAILNSANLEDGDAPGSRLDRVFTLAQDYGAAVICLLHRRGGPGPRRRVEDAGGPAHRRPRHRRATASSAPTSSSTRSPSRCPPATTTSAATPWRPWRPSSGIKEEIPGVHTTLGLSNVSFGLNPGGPPRPQLRVHRTSA